MPESTSSASVNNVGADTHSIVGIELKTSRAYELEAVLPTLSEIVAVMMYGASTVLSSSSIESGKVIWSEITDVPPFRVKVTESNEKLLGPPVILNSMVSVPLAFEAAAVNLSCIPSRSVVESSKLVKIGRLVGTTPSTTSANPPGPVMATVGASRSTLTV